MHIDLYIALAGLIVGFVVGLTGMGGGALMTPILILIFKVQPLAAVSSDLVASLIMKPIGGGVHARRGTVNYKLCLWLMIGSIPAAVGGVLLLKLLGGESKSVQNFVQVALGVALTLAAAAIVVKALVNLRQRAKGMHLSTADAGSIVLKPIPTIIIGAVGGLIVGMTSVGSGSVIIVCLLFLYPRLRAQQLVGTDLVQAIPLVGAAALGHVLILGDFQLALTASLLIGCIPGVFLGAQASSRAPARVIRRALAFVLLASGLKLLQLGNTQLGAVLLAVVVVGPVLWIFVRRSNGLMFRRDASSSEAASA